MREYVKNLTSKCKEWEETYTEKENATHSFQKKYEEAMSKISELTVQMNVCNSSMAMSIGSSNCSDCKSLRKAITAESSVVSQLKKHVGRKDKKINSLKRRLLERSGRDVNVSSRS
jgi:phage shock protein A